MSAQIIPFPTHPVPLDPLAEQFYQYAVGEYPNWKEIEDDLDESVRRMFLWITWDRWRQRAGLWDLEQPDLVAFVHRIVKHNTRH